jgi:hypothetical protein
LEPLFIELMHKPKRTEPWESKRRFNNWTKHIETAINE